MTTMETMSRVERRKQRTRDLLKDAARDILFGQGYAALTIQGITDKADLGYGTFYLHFTDKDDIAWAVMHDLAESYMLQIQEMIKDVPTPRREYLSWLTLFQVVDSSRERFAQMYGSHGSANLFWRYQNWMANNHEKTLRNGQYSALLDLPPEILAQFITGAVMRLLVWWVETPNDYTAEQMTTMLFKIAYRMDVPEG